MVLECLSLAHAAEDTVRKHPVPAPRDARRQGRRSGRQEPRARGDPEGAVALRRRSPGLLCLLLPALQTKMGPAGRNSRVLGAVPCLAQAPTRGIPLRV